MSTRITDLAAVLTLWGTFFLSLVLPLALGLFLLLTGAFFLVANRARLDKVAIVLLVNVAYWLFSGMLVGSLAPYDLVNPLYLNGEGRMLISYLPLFFYGAATVQWSNVDTLVRTILHVALASMFFLLVWIATGASFLSEGMAGNYAGFLTSHTGGGGFFGLLSVFLILFGHFSGKRLVHFAGWLMLVPLLASASRSAMLAFLVVFVWYLVKTRHQKALIGGLVALMTIAALTPVLFPHTWSRTSALFNAGLLDSVAEQIEASKEWEPTGAGKTDDQEDLLVGSNQNVLARFAFWSYAVRRFSQSPIFGIGYGRYNDGSLELAGVENLVFMAFGGIKNTSAGNAHNSYLQILCELGVVGLALFLWLWFSVYFRLVAAAREYWQWRDMHSLMVAAQGMVVFALISALTGHALAAPSIMLPLMIVVGVALAAQRSFEPVLRKS